MSRPIPSTRGRYLYGVGLTITRANIRDEQDRRTERGLEKATPEEVVRSFASAAEQYGWSFGPGNKTYARRLERATLLMTGREVRSRTPRPKRRAKSKQ